MYNMGTGDIMSNFISIKNLDYIKNKTKILNNINMDIDKNSFIGVIGSNSSGKTTLLKVISGIIPTNNKVVIDYNYLNTRKNKDDLLKIGCYFGDYNNFLFDDVYLELAFVLENMNMEIEEIDKKILEISDFFGINKLLDKKCNDLKQEEKQIIGLILALIHNPKLLVLDNPFSMMRDSIKKDILNKLLKWKNKHNLTIVLSSNNLEDIILTDYTYVLDKGKIVMEGKTMSIFKEDIYLKKIGLELPFSIDLSIMLNFYEIYNDLTIDYNEVIDKLWN